VFNPLMSDRRRNSDVAHEVAHIVLGHSLSRLERLGDVAFLTYDKKQEDEAAWLSGCLLLPRFALINDLRRRRNSATIAKRRTLSREMVDYRVRVTGVARQLAAAQRRRAS
ncbi:MAG: ImmA/IrrE family metallo-endopeptidase, partial [Holophagales bacterium]|nr:ImmA/IrrE family metallo-endopeptidase [Holophagales bacterium]